ncbi:MAG: CBS domain-containing protein [candidate division Zixibacteria bacterium]|nr:CBS domain-containing protein [candidate division Zixibacteria bacterium]
MLVKSLLDTKSKQIVTAVPSMSIDDAMGIMINKKIGCLPVTDAEDRLIGILSDTDIFRKIYEMKGGYDSLKVKDVMTTDLIVGLPSDDIDYIAGLMEKNWIQHVPIVEGDKVVGLISSRDIIKTQAESRQVENRYLLDMLEKRDKSGDT